jgi:MFS family permease
MNNIPSAPHSTPSASAWPRGSAYKWWVVALLWLVCFFNYADRQSINSVLSIIEKEFGFSPVQLGLVASAFAWTYAGFALLAGLVADRVPRKTLILSACVVWSMFTLGTAWCGALAGFLTVRALTGLGETMYYPAAMSLLSDYHGRRTRSSAMAWHQSAVYAGTILGSWMAAILAEKMGWRFPFYLFGPIGILLAAILFCFLREPRRGAADAADDAAILPEGKGSEGALSVRETLAVIFRTPAAVLLMLAFLVANFVAVIFLAWTPTFLVKKFAFSLGSAGLSGTVYIHLASAVSVPIAGYLADRLARRFAGGRMAVQAAGLIFGAFFVFLVGTTGDVTTLIAAMILFGIGKGFYDSGIFAALYDTVEPRARGTAAGIMNMVGWGGGALGPLYVGLAMKYGRQEHDWQNMSQAIAWCGLIYLVGAALLLSAIVLFRRRDSILVGEATT